MKKILCILMVYVNVALLNAQTITPDTVIIDTRSYSEEVIQYYLNQKAYNYDLDPRYEQNPIKKMWYSFLRKVFDGLGERTLGVIWLIFRYALIGFGIFIIARFLFRSNKTRLFKKEDKSPEFQGALIKSESGGEDLLKLIQIAEKDTKYSSAVAYRFLHLLREMDQADIISWRDYKTNSDYWKEISNDAIKQHLKELSRIFEYVVYGNFELDADQYDRVKKMFVQFSEQTLKTIEA